MARNRTLEYLEQAQRQLPGGMPARTVPGYGGQINYGALPPRQPYGGLDLPPELFGPMKPPATQPMPQMQPATQPAQPAPQMQPAYPMPPAFDMAASRERAMQAGRDLRANTANFGGGVPSYAAAAMIRQAGQLGGAGDMYAARQAFMDYRGGAARRADETPEQFQQRAQQLQLAQTNPLESVGGMMDDRRALIAAGYDPRVPASAQQMRDTGQAAIRSAEGDYLTGVGRQAQGVGAGALSQAQAADLPATLPARLGDMQSEAELRRQQAARIAAMAPEEVATERARGRLYGAQAGATEAGTGMVQAGRALPPDFAPTDGRRVADPRAAAQFNAMAEQEGQNLANLQKQKQAMILQGIPTTDVDDQIAASMQRIEGFRKQATGMLVPGEMGGDSGDRMQRIQDSSEAEARAKMRAMRDAGYSADQIEQAMTYLYPQFAS